MSFQTAYCRSCSAPIIWAETALGRRIPVNTTYSVSGNIWLEPRGDGRPPLANMAAHLRPPAGTPLRTSHFATCEFAAHHHRKRPPRPKVDEPDLYGRGAPNPRRDSLPKSNPAAPPKEPNE